MGALRGKVLNPDASGWEDEAKGKVSHDQSLDGPGHFPLALVGVPLLDRQVSLLGSRIQSNPGWLQDQVPTSTEAPTNQLCWVVC